jgi:hypothetical protein
VTPGKIFRQTVRIRLEAGEIGASSLVEALPATSR